MSVFYAQYPASAAGSNASVGTNGAPAPGSSTEIGGVDGLGNLVPVSVDSSGAVNVNVVSPTGGATAANQVLEIAQLTGIHADTTSINGKLNSLGQKTSAASVPVVIASDQSAVPVSAASLPLPAGAATSANQTSQIAQETAIAASVASIDTKTPPLGAALIAASTPVNIASNQTVPVSAASLPLPSGASTSALQTSGNASLTSIDGKLNSLGQKTSAASVPVVVASDQSAIPISATSLPLPSGAATSALQTTGNSSLSSIDGKLNSLGQKTSANSVPVVIASDQSAVAISAASLPLPSGAATETTLSALNAKFNSLGQKTSANSAPVVISSDQSTLNVSAAQSGTWTVQPGNTANTTPWLVAETTSSTSSVTSVASSATSVSLLATNANRKNATFFNDSTQILYLKLGATASTTSYTVQLTPNSYYELPVGKIYTGAIDGIWAAANGNVRITELT